MVVLGGFAANRHWTFRERASRKAPRAADAAAPLNLS
jgi:hypothetical protein